ncbi:MAG: C40 family peptidase [Candidatus Eisenbacteria bacterium]|uniref:C40 family peptidase n=1 Tax=Eiseniibacteriota bacterium TaxID=2212470 RepID=A0A948RX00_UNCEI|nr:C40 family peptidase [Candidatus Eisenbacteria bacterium]MBU1951116.1 C40 family peptidase [Candidatus Eisenbacteria bacterium]MBU2689794.1 C40 family peptidase [Candidatus Eisenbacteria bacterium]
MNLALVKTLVEPVRREPAHTSEMIDQVLGGMILSIVSPPKTSPAISGLEGADWIQAQGIHAQWIHAQCPNGTIGYLRSWMCEPVDSSSPWCAQPGVMVRDRWLSSVPEEEGEAPVCLGMGTRCLGSVSSMARSAVETPWGCRVKLPSIGLLPAAKPFLSGFYGGAGRLERKEDLSKEALFALLEGALERSRLLLQAPYLWGGVSPGGFDCSGLVNLCVGMEGLRLPRDSGDQCRWFCDRGWGNAPDATLDAAPGLAFFGEALDKIDHVGFLDGDGGMIHASGNVHRTLLNPEPDEEGRRLLIRCRWVVSG